MTFAIFNRLALFLSGREFQGASEEKNKKKRLLF
jgi:hypothetical protein